MSSIPALITAYFLVKHDFTLDFRSYFFIQSVVKISRTRTIGKFEIQFVLSEGKLQILGDPINAPAIQ